MESQNQPRHSRYGDPFSDQDPDRHGYPPDRADASETDTLPLTPGSRSTVLDGQRQPSDYGKWNTRIRLMLCLVIPTYLETLDYTVVATAQPHIASAFNRLDLQSWIGTSYVLTSTVFLPIYGSIADILGRHWALQCSMLFFLIGSIICTGAQSMTMLLVGRGIAGVGAAGLVSVVRIIISDSNSIDEDNFMSTVLVVLYALGYSTGPIIGGALLKASFRWIFALNLPTIILSSILTVFLIRPILRPAQPSQRLKYLSSLHKLPSFAQSSESRETPLQKFLRVDWVGTILFISGGILVLLALSLGSTSEAQGFGAPIVIVSFAAGFSLLALFVAWEYLISKYILAAEDEHFGQPRRFPGFLYACPKWFRLTEPSIPLDIFKNYDICATCFAAMTGGMVLFSAFYFLGIFFSIVKGMDPTHSGAQLLYFSPGLGVGVLIAKWIIQRLRQPKYPVILGCVLIPVAIGLLSTAIAGDSQKQLNGYLFFTGLAIGLTFGPLALHARFSQPTSRVAAVVSMNLFFRTAGGTIGLAQLSAVLESKVKSYLANLGSAVEALSETDKSALESLSGGSLDSVDSILNLPPDVRNLVQDAFRKACQWSFISLIPWCCVAAILCLFLSAIPEDVLDPTGAREKEADVTMGRFGLQQPHKNMEPWRTVPPPRGLVSLVLWPIRVAFAYLR
ncbi:hypothetical protein M407DRAFT_231873 [Tulasnella calospora MUT 4182]|uniref:Major facilitator superfamily (MFS) profile domain-containing protein n=1 Tax=Tulasnella calospora MUT 4182 TaxID=1051891 RepID=A0A0C3LI56_9AGAM|nr:hypothetical protein M407DRAFT_231873 [Tulasnella calospora MUT 4182]